MALSDPQTITVNAVAQVLKRTSSGINTGTFRTNDGNYTLEVAHSYGKRQRHTVVLRQRKIAADPLAPTLNVEVTQSVRVTIDTPTNLAFTVAENKLLWDGFAAWLAASSGAAETSILGGEN
ncbi:coat protein [ssRNA phage Esthiorhiza.4_15]|uniref:Coat protein n=2 Tax=Leviviricetes TaxID=2842243 RepID=A0A8S5KZQ2_9VIRU|nr:coat protein [ssRNA phage Esthiorhiza.4_15]QDH87403.1 MAG: hypothetical protein H4RhizoLitter21562_000002 [Leviviridae sp.]DAD50557.1 TPA_asm: coat protein [ssRNA phage Esthiorhiza.4_15]